MTKKDFELIARTLKAMDYSLGKEHLIASMALALAATNPRFNAKKFRQACGME